MTRPVSDPSPSDDALARPNGDRVRFLVVDDDRTCCRVAALALRPFGGVQMLSEGAAAVLAVDRQLAAGHRFELLLIDIYMPGLDGLGAIQAIRASEVRFGVTASNRMRVVVSSVARSPRLVERHLSGLIDGYLIKPLDRRRLIRQLIEWGLIDRQAVAEDDQTPTRRYRAES